MEQKAFWGETLKKEGGMEKTVKVSEKTGTKSRSLQDKDLFRLCDLVFERRKHDAWVLYQDAVLKGIPSLDIFWKIFGQVKNMLVVKNGGGKKFHPFYYGKIKKSAGNFNESELVQYSSELVEMFHKDFYGQSDLDFSLEKFILKI